MRKIIRKEQIISRTTPEPSFDILNQFFRELVYKESPQQTDEVNQGLSVWEVCWEKSDDSKCDECLFGKHQEWIFSSNLNGVSDLCTLIKKAYRKKLKYNKPADIMKYGKRLPGSGFSKQ